MEKGPRISLSGFAILFVYVSAMTFWFLRSNYGRVLYLSPYAGENYKKYGIPLAMYFVNVINVSFSLINVISHSAVALGFIGKVCYVRVYAGVYFDFLTRCFQFFWFFCLSLLLANTIHHNIDSHEIGDKYGNTATTIIIVILGISFLIHLTLHVRALVGHHLSYNRLSAIVTSGLNNINGVPGPYYMDHIFAYTDLGLHVFPFGASSYLLFSRHSLLYSILGVLVFAAGPLAIIKVVFIFFDSYDVHSKIAPPALLLQTTPENNQKVLKCLCDTCVGYPQGQGNFSINLHDRRAAVCQLWYLTYEELAERMQLSIPHGSKMT